MGIDGYKTYFVGAMMVIATVAYGMNYISTEHYLTIMGIFNGTGFLTVRHAISKIPEVLPAEQTSSAPPQDPPSLSTQSPPVQPSIRA